MFGSTDRLEKQLRNGGGKTAVAHIVEAKKGRFALSSGGDAARQVASAHINWTLTLQVAPDGESPFDAVPSHLWPAVSVAVVPLTVPASEQEALKLTERRSSAPPPRMKAKEQKRSFTKVRMRPRIV